MLTSIALGDRVKLEPGSRWESYGGNPASSVGGVIAANESGWVLVLWDGQTEPKNYRPFDLVPEV